MKKNNNQKGFTLLEILIVLVIIAVAMGGIRLMGQTTRSLLRQESRKLVTLIRYVYYQASAEGRYYRVAFDLENQKYLVEYSDYPFYITQENDEKEELRKQNEENNKDFFESDDEEPVQKVQTADFSESEDDLTEIREIPEGIKIAGIYVAHHTSEINQGKVYLYFFPRGQTEFAAIYLSDQEEEIYKTLIVNPLTGKVDLREEYVSYEDLLDELGIEK